MLSKIEEKIKSEVVWKDLGEGIHVTHFSSKSNSQQIYLKKIIAKKKTGKNITVFLFHDLSSYHGRFIKMTKWFQAHHPEISFVLVDFLGHGLSSGTRGHVANFNDLVDDAASVFEIINKETGDEWVALGHGMGAVVIIDLLNRFDEAIKNKIDKVIFSNFFLTFPFTVLKLQKKIFESFLGLANALKTSRAIEVFLPGEILTDAHEQVVYLEDPLIVRRPTYETLKIISLKVKNIHQDSYFLDKPTLLLKSDSPYLMEGAMESFGKGLKKGLLTEKKYVNLKHDLYNERKNTFVFNDIAEWIQS